MAASMRRVSVVWFVAMALALSLIGTMAAPVRAADFVVDSTEDASDINLGDGICRSDAGPDEDDCTLRAAIEEANSDVVEDVITLDPALCSTSCDFQLTLGSLDVSESLTITGAADPATVDIIGNEDENDRVIRLDGAGDEITVNISGVTVRGGHDRVGAGIKVRRGVTLNLSNSVVSGNIGDSNSDGAGIYIQPDATANLTGVTVTGNDATNEGGGIYVEAGGTLNLEGGSFVSNNEANRGGGIYVDDSSEAEAAASATITASTITGNRAEDDGDGEGGGIWSEGLLVITGSSITSNRSDDDGGGVYNTADDTDERLVITTTTIADNYADDEGGGIYNDAGAISVVRSTVADNDASDGAGIFNHRPPLLLQRTEPTLLAGQLPTSEVELLNSTVSFNTAEDEGGGIYSEGDLQVSFSTIATNTALDSSDGGGGIFFDGAGDAEFYASIIANNTSDDCSSGDSVTTHGSNIDSDNSCGLDPSEDHPGVDPKLGPLAANEPGTTQTHALASDSVAVDAVEPAELLEAGADFLLVGASSQPVCGPVSSVPTPTLLTDQRGVSRPQDGDEDGVEVCDIGAYELIPVPPTVSISDAPDVVEGNTGTTIEATFTVTLSRASARNVTVAYATANGTATANADYLAEAGVVTFLPGDLTEPVTVTVVGDALDELNEDFFVNLSAPVVEATIDNAQGRGRILDDDGPAAISINDVTVTEGDSGFVNATFTVRVLPASSQTVTVAYATANGTATAPGDYESATGTVTFVPGDTEQTITVRVAGDTVAEATEAFVVNLSTPTGDATISDSQGTGTILDNEVVREATLGSTLPNTTTLGGGLVGWGAPGLAIGLLVLSATVVINRRRLTVRTP